MAKVLITYEAEASSLKTVVNEVNKTNDAVVISAQESSKKVADSYKAAGKSIEATFSAGQTKKVLDEQAKAFDNVAKKSAPLTRVLRGLKNELNQLEEEGKSNTARFRQLTVEAARLEDQIGDTRARVKILASDTFKFDAAVGATQGLATGFEIAQGASALFGEENEDLQKVIAKTTAVTALANGVQQAAALIKDESAIKTFVLTRAESAYALVVGKSTGALKGLRIALASTGVGLLVIGIGLLIANFDKLKDAIFGTSDTTRALKSTLEDVKTGLSGAVEETSKVGNAFELAKQGVISKEEALLIYNETLGDSFGKTNSLNKAEENYIKKKDAYIQATAARAQAQALLAQSAALTAEAATVTGEEATNFGESIQTFIGDAIVGFNNLIGNSASATTIVYKAQTESIRNNAKERVKGEKEAQALILNNLATSKLKEAELIENNAGIASEIEQKVNDKRLEAATAAAEKLKEKQDKAREQLANLEKEAFANQLNEREKILNESNNKIIELEKNFIDAKFKAGSIEEIKFNDSVKSIKEQAIKDIAAIDQKALEDKQKAEKEAAEKSKQEAEKLAEEKLKISIAAIDAEINAISLLEVAQGSSLERRIRLIELDGQKRIKEAGSTAGAIELINAQTEKNIREERRKTTLDSIEKVDEYVNAVQDVFGSLNELSKANSESRISDIQGQSSVELDAINRAQISEEEKQKRRAALELRTSRAITAEKIKQAKRDKALALFNTAIDTAVSIIKTGAQLGYPAAIPFQIAAGVVGATQLAAINAQQLPKFKKGGLINGKLHSEGGTIIEAEKGEFIINRGQTSMYKNELMAINNSSFAFKKLISEKYVRPALIDFALKSKKESQIINTTLNSKSMEKEIRSLNKKMSNKNIIININRSDYRYLWR